MNTILSRNNHADTRYLLSAAYEAIHAKLKSILSPVELTLFAIPERRNTETIWLTEQAATIVPFQNLTDDQKDQVSDILDDIKSSVYHKIISVSELQKIADKIFIIPTENNVVVLKDATGELKVVLTQWACTKIENTSSPDPLSIFINRPRSNRSRVKIEVHYTDGTPAPEKSFFFEYGETTKPFKTDKSALKDLGQFKHGVQFTIYEQIGNEKKHVHDFIVQEGKDIYSVIFPFYTEAVVTVLDQTDKPCVDIPIEVDYNGQVQRYLTNSNGNIEVQDLEAGQEIMASIVNDPANSTIQRLEKANNSLMLYIQVKHFAPVLIKVLSTDQEILPNYPLQVTYEGKEELYYSNDQGEVRFNEIETGIDLGVKDGNNLAHTSNYQVVEGANEFLFEIKLPEPKIVRIKLIDHRNKPLPQVPLSIINRTGEFKQSTNADGQIALPFESFVDRKKVKVNIHFQRRRKEKIIRKGFTFKTEQLDYVIKLKKISRWWLLLLLLLLLIRCEKTIYVKTLDAQSKKTVAEARVHLDYHKAYLYDQGRFFTNDLHEIEQLSNAKGETEFGKLKYSVYSLIFKNFSRATIFATSNCYASDTLRPLFHYLWNKDTLTLELHPVFTSLDFKVIDQEDQEPLPDAEVEIITELDGNNYMDSGLTGADGRILFKKIPRCGRIVKIIAKEEGYFPDSLLNKIVGNLLSGSLEQSRLLSLKPQLGLFSFFVVDCKSKKPIAGANVSIEVDYNSRKTKKTKTTNVDGKGKGFSEDHVLARLHLSGKAPYYKSGELPGWHFVKDFIDPAKYPDEKRTFCLEPEENCLEFTNVDENTGKPLAGVKNIIVIKNGSDSRTETVISNRDGVFTVCSIIGDILSITAQYPPDYDDNNTKIKDVNSIDLIKAPTTDRIIPLKPKEVELKFRTIDGENGSVVPDADLIVYADGVPLNGPTSSGTGEFIIVVPITAVISIEASKAGYGSNTTKVNNLPVKALMPPASQDERDIPLMEDVLPCDQAVSEGAGTSQEMYFQLGSKSYHFDLFYNMQGHPDNIKIYCGKGTSGTLLFDRWIYTTENSPQRIYFYAKVCKGFITVVIEPAGGDQSSDWEFSISCPE